MSPRLIANLLLVGLLLFSGLSRAAAQNAGGAPAARVRKQIVFGGDREFSPLEFIDAKGKPQGFQVELIREIGRAMDWDVSIRLGPWEEVRQAFLDGQIDIVGMARDATREEWADFGAPHTAITSEIFVRRGSPEIRTLHDLNGKEVLVQSGSLAAEILAARYPAIRPAFESDCDDVLRTLASGRHDAAIVPQFAGRAAIRRLGLAHITTTGPTVFAADYCFAVRKGNHALLSELSKGLEIVKAGGAFSRIYDHWLGEVERPALSLKQVLGWSGLVVGPIAALALIALIWSLSLRRAVQQKTAALRAEFEQRTSAERERAQLSEALQRARRMESIGRLSGGIAHDFNNVLTAVIGFAELSRPATDSAAVRDNMDQIIAAANRAARLTRSLLAFARRQPAAPELVNPNDAVRSAERLLRRLLPSNVSFEAELGAVSGRVFVDPTLLEQVVLNLVINARDAMPRGGMLSIETYDLHIDEEWQDSQHSLKHGPHVAIAVRDTGSGMSAETQARIFEPYFTTKPSGNGLGLATSLGTITQAGGVILVDSRPDEGSTFTIVLPHSTRVAEPTPERTVAPVPDGGERQTTVLVAEGDALVRHLCVQALRNAGYFTLEAEDGRQALEVAAAHHGPIDALVSDILLPHVDTTDFIRKLQATRRSLRVLILSGYPDKLDDLASLSVTAVLPKPFSPGDLLSKLRQVMGGSGPRPVVEAVGQASG